MTNEPGFSEVWRRIPWVTRHVSALVIFLFVIYSLNPYWAVMGWRLPQAPIYEAWRWVLAPFSYSGDRLSGIFAVFIFCSNLQQLELHVFKKRSILVYYLLWISLCFNIIGIRLGFYAFLSGLNCSMTWTLAQFAPLEATMLMGIIPVQRCYMPLAMAMMGLITQGSWVGALEPLLGIAAGHMHLYFTELLPQANGPEVLAEPPSVLKKLDEWEENDMKRETYGHGQRLGNEKSFWNFFR